MLYIFDRLTIIKPKWPFPKKERTQVTDALPKQSHFIQFVVTYFFT